MKPRARSVLIIIAALLFVSGCAHAEPLVTKMGIGTFIHPIEEPALRYPACYESCECRCCKERVHVFAINGLNPLCLGNFNGLCSFCKKIGFQHTYFGQLYTSYWFGDKIREIRRTDPDARIVLVGFSLGANYVEAVANDLARDGVQVDLLVYLVGDFVRDNSYARPANVRRIVNVRARGLIFSGGDLLFNGADLEGARNVRLDYRHILIPSRRETLELLQEELLTEAWVPTGKAPAATGAASVATPPKTGAVPLTPSVTIPVSRTTSIPTTGVPEAAPPLSIPGRTAPATGPTSLTPAAPRGAIFGSPVGRTLD
ncbi:MAG: hypothetical protein U0793_16905 [Gemmataceae bacterium]